MSDLELTPNLARRVACALYFQANWEYDVTTNIFRDKRVCACLDLPVSLTYVSITVYEERDKERERENIERKRGPIRPGLLV